MTSLATNDMRGDNDLIILSERDACHDFRIRESVGKIISTLKLLGNIFIKRLTTIIEN